MKTLQELLAAKAAKVDALLALDTKMSADGYTVTKEDDDAWAAAKKEIADLDKAIERKKEADALKASTAVVVRDVQQRESVAAIPKMIVSTKSIVGDNAGERAYKAGQFFLASMFGHEKAATWCKENGILIQKAQSEGINSAGGVLVPEELLSEIIVLRNTVGLARRELRVLPMGRDTITVPKLLSGLTAYFVGEGVAATASDVTLSNVRLTAKKLAALNVYSSELSEDAVVDVGDLIVGEVAYALADKEDDCLFSGDGTSTYGGITGLRSIFNTGVGSLAGSVDAASGHDTMAEIDATDLAIVQGKLPQYVYDRGNPKWYCSQTMFANVFERLIGASGGVTKDQASGRTLREYNGYPIEITPKMLAPAAPSTDASDVAMILFGDLNMSATMGDRRGLTISRSTEYKFAEDQIAIKGTERFDINVHNTGDTSTPGSIVALMGE